MNENLIIELERDGIVTATFRKLDPEKKKTLYVTALTAFSEDVFDRVSFDYIAETAGVSKGSLFQYFGNKENLLRFTCEIFIDNYRQFWDSQRTRAEGIHTRERIRDFSQTLLDFRAERKVEYAFYVKMLYENSRNLTDDFLQKINRILLEHLNRVISRGARTAEIRQDIPAERIAFVITALIEASHRYSNTINQKLRNREKLMDIIEDIEGMLFDGIKG